MIIIVLDVAETLLSNENVESAATAAENYQDSQSINNSFKVIRQCHDIYCKYTTDECLTNLLFYYIYHSACTVVLCGSHCLSY